MSSYGKSNSFGAMWQSSSTSAAHTCARLADLAPHLTPYRYGFNNPIRYHDPTGLFEVARDGFNADWLEKDGDDGKKVVFWDAKVTDASHIDPNSGQKYLGKEGYGIDVETGKGVHYKSDGTKTMANVSLRGITITPDEAYVTDNPSISTNNLTRYIYNERDLKVREGLMKSDNPIKTFLLMEEKQVRFNILNGHDYWMKHGHTNGNLRLMLIYTEMAFGIIEPGPIRSVKPYNLKPSGIKSSVPTRQEFIQSQKGKHVGKYKGKGAWLKVMHAEYDKLYVK